MRFPYGMADFQAIITEGYFYVDRTDRVPLIEEAGATAVPALAPLRQEPVAVHPGELLRPGRLCNWPNASDFIEPDLENGAIRCEIVQRSAETPQCSAGRHPRSVVMA